MATNSQNLITKSLSSAENFLNSSELDFYLNESVKISSFDFLKSLIAAAILGFLINLVYIRYSNPLSNKVQFSKNFVILSMTTCVIITIVKSSLALSLGLVGALSIVRFRAAIKEPEELVYLFLTIAAGLGTGAGQIKISVFGILFILLIIIIQKLFQKNDIDNNFSVDDGNLKLSISKKGIFKSQEIISIEKQFDKNFDFIKFISINSNKISSVRNYEIKTKNKDKIEKVIDSMNEKFSDITILVVNNQRIIWF